MNTEDEESRRVPGFTYERKTFFKRTRWESAVYLDFVRTHPCCASGCNDTRTEAHHWHESEKGQGRKPSDCFCVPLCREHHQQWHTEGQLPGMMHVNCRELFTRVQRALMAEWIQGRGENAEDPLF